MILDLNLTWKNTGEIVAGLSSVEYKEEEEFKICASTFIILTGKKFTEVLCYYSNSPCLKDCTLQ